MVPDLHQANHPPFPMQGMSATDDYYAACANDFFEATAFQDMGHLYRPFLARIPRGGHILDAGCGSGRDAKAFRQFGYQVAAFDASPALAALARTYSGVPVVLRSFADVDEVEQYDGIWACASLLHVPRADLPDAFVRLWAALRPGGVLYVSMKEGEGERQEQGRHFTDESETGLRSWVAAYPDAASVDTWITEGRPSAGGRQRWVNALFKKQLAAAPVA